MWRVSAVVSDFLIYFYSVKGLGLASFHPLPLLEVVCMCMYVCMYVCTCMYVCMYVLCVHVCLGLNMYVWVCAWARPCVVNIDISIIPYTCLSPPMCKFYT